MTEMTRTDSMSDEQVTAMFDGFCEDERWNGCGYLAARRLAAESTIAADRVVLNTIEESGYLGDRELVFQFCNSKFGRWFGDNLAYPRVSYVTDFLAHSTFRY